MGRKGKSKPERRASLSTPLPKIASHDNEEGAVVPIRKRNEEEDLRRTSVQRAVIHRLPPPFPSHLPRPPRGFLQDVEPYRESFRTALQTSYQGIAVDTNLLPREEEEASSHHHLNESTVQQHLRSIEPYFVTDVTQPFGLGTPCTPTYVTRCLFGESGTTYKYLGLRMFAHDWQRSTIEQLKDRLAERVTQKHLPDLQQQRSATDAPSKSHRTDTTDHKSCFDVCLINRMTLRNNLKTEPLDERYKIAVSWHADSSLDHYSTIAVYQTILPPTPIANVPLVGKKTTQRAPPKPNVSSHQDEWSIGLRVMHYAEGPKPLGVAAEKESDAPPIALSLPSNAAYYLLDDFNHHHQHTVLVAAPSSKRMPSVRYSLTYRLLRESHNARDMIERCHRCIAQFHKKGSKLFRYEQLTLTELESEWLRQFYIQGSHHHSILWADWQGYISQLWDCWSQLETRTWQTIQFLQHAAEGACWDVFHRDASSDPPGTKMERKLREKRRKAYTTMTELSKRESPFKWSSLSGIHPLYESMTSLLEERATMRELWIQREMEPAFQKVDAPFRPLPVPWQFNIPSPGVSSTTPSHTNASPGLGTSPLPGTPKELRQLAMAIHDWGMAFQTGIPADIPIDVLSLFGSETKLTDGSTATRTNENDNAATTLQSLDWDGWSQNTFGLEMQYPWSTTLLEGRKTIETRAYSLPEALIGRKVWIIETPTGTDGVSGIMGHHCHFTNDDKEKKMQASLGSSSDMVGPRVVGWCIFSSVKQYSSRCEFEQDEKCHLVSSQSKYGWNEGETKKLYGWIVGEYGLRSPRDDGRFQSGIRRFRSLFQLTPDVVACHDDDDDDNNSTIASDKDARSTKSDAKKKKALKRGSNINRKFESPPGFSRKKRRY